MNKYGYRCATLLMLSALSKPAIAGNDAPIYVTVSGTIVPSTCKISAPASVALAPITLDEAATTNNPTSYPYSEFHRDFTLKVDKASCGQSSVDGGVYLAFSGSTVQLTYGWILKNTDENGAKGIGLSLIAKSYSNHLWFDSTVANYIPFSRQDDTYGEITMAVFYELFDKKNLSVGPLTADTTISVIYN